MHFNLYSMYLLGLLTIGLPMAATECPVLRGHFHEHTPHEQAAAHLLLGYFNEKPTQDDAASDNQPKPKEQRLAQALKTSSSKE